MEPGSYVSTGRLPPDERVQALVEEAHRRFATLDDGAVSAVYPALERADPALWGLSVVTADGRSFTAGDAGHPFTIMSVSKPFVFALVCAAIGPQPLREKVGVNATGYAFNSVAGVERSPDGRTNPMVNAGAIATTSLVPGADADAKWRFLHEGLSAFAGRSLPMNEEVLESARQTNHRNRALASFLRSVGAIYTEPMEAVDLYTMQCSLDVTARDLAVMGATLADGGVNPITGARVCSPADCHHALAVMTIAGMYETSGDWLYDVGLPGKSGIGGGIVTVAPGKGALGTFAPRLDAAGNSVRGQAAARFLSAALGMDILASEPVGAPA